MLGQKTHIHVFTQKGIALGCVERCSYIFVKKNNKCCHTVLEYGLPGVSISTDVSHFAQRSRLLFSRLNWKLEIKYHKIPKISPSMYKPLQIQAPLTGNAKNPPLNRPSKYKPLGACTWKIALKYKEKQSKKGRFTFNCKASPIDFETQISLCR